MAMKDYKNMENKKIQTKVGNIMLVMNYRHVKLKAEESTGFQFIKNELSYRSLRSKIQENYEKENYSVV